AGPSWWPRTSWAPASASGSWWSPAPPPGRPWARTRWRWTPPSWASSTAWSWSERKTESRGGERNMRDNLTELIFSAGVVGCGGAGFPTHKKVCGQVEDFIVNGVECEPLLRTDRYIMAHYARELVETVAAIGAFLQAKRRVIGVKRAYAPQVEALEAAIRETGAAVELHLLESFYPAGDEQVLVHEVTGRTVPPGGIPLAVGAVVDNAATVLAIHDAMAGRPLT